MVEFRYSLTDRGLGTRVSGSNRFGYFVYLHLLDNSYLFQQITRLDSPVAGIDS